MSAINTGEVQLPGSHSRLKIAICGGGIGGLALAAFLSKSSDIEVHIFESRKEFREDGAGLALWERYCNILNEELDFEAVHKANFYPLPDWTQVKGPALRKSDTIVQNGEFFRLDHGFKSIARKFLILSLVKAINFDHVKSHLSTTFERYSIRDDLSVALHFKNGPDFEADVLIGADGIQSRVRASMFESTPLFANPHFTGQFAYRMECSMTDLASKNTRHPALSGFTFWCGKGRHVTSTVVDKVYITAWENTDEYDKGAPFPGDKVLQEKNLGKFQIVDHFQSWEPDLLSLLDFPEEASKWAVHSTAKLPQFVSGPVAIMGDAAHAMTPHKGLGAGQAIEDAYILARLLTYQDTTQADVRDALNIYDQIRRPLAQQAAADSQFTGEVIEFLEPNYQNAPLHEIGDKLAENCEWLREKKGCKNLGNKAVELFIEKKKAVISGNSLHG